MQKKLFLNTSVMFVSYSVRMVLNMALAIVIGNRLGPSALGGYSILMTFALVFDRIGQIGLPRLIVRKVARLSKADGESVIVQALTLGLVAATGVTVALALLSFVLPYSDEVRVGLFFVALSLLPTVLIAILESYFQGQERLQLVALSQLVSRVLFVAFSVALMFGGGGVADIAQALLVAQCLTLGLMTVILVRSLEQVKARLFALAAYWQLALESLDFLKLTFATVLFSKLDTLILSFLVTESELGIYSAAWLVVQGVTFVFTAFSQSIYPVLAREFERSRERFERYVRNALAFALGSSVLLSGVVFVAAPLLLSILFSQRDYSESVIVLRILAVFIVAFSLNAIMANSLFSSDKQRISVSIANIKLVVGIPLYVALIYFYGALGAAVATVVIGFVGVALNYREVPHGLKLWA